MHTHHTFSTTLPPPPAPFPLPPSTRLFVFRRQAPSFRTFGAPPPFPCWGGGRGVCPHPPSSSLTPPFTGVPLSWHDLYFTSCRRCVFPATPQVALSLSSLPLFSLRAPLTLLKQQHKYSPLPPSPSQPPPISSPPPPPPRRDLRSLSTRTCNNPLSRNNRRRLHFLYIFLCCIEKSCRPHHRLLVLA